ncbi:ParA family protein [Shewanella glacialipiscicola]|uniref:ParA family protein n=1 Tax=Shewanella glacialipiscicola TaxID=614069 RepID=UPI003D7ACDC6
MGKIITLATQKGGTGKSTVLMHVAHDFHLNGFSVCILDTDDQLTLANFEKSRGLLKAAKESEGVDLDYPSVQSITSKQPYREFISKIKDRFDYILIDTKGEFNQFQYDLIRLSDFVICPVAPSELDLNPTVLVSDAVEHENGQRSESEPKIGMAYCITKADGSNTLKHVVSLIKEKTKRTVVMPYMRKADPVTACTGIGLTVFDAAKSFTQVKKLINMERAEDAKSSLDKAVVLKVAEELKEMAACIRGLIK